MQFKPFQFYKVRLKVMPLIQQLTTQELFQFYKVRLKDLYNFFNPVTTSFQFYKVRLKDCRSGRDEQQRGDFNSIKFD